MTISETLNILMVEDQVIIALGTKAYLEKIRYNVTICKNGELAIAEMAKNPAIDLILMDIDLGDGIDGITTARLILDKLDIPIIFVSAHTEPEIIGNTERVTAYGYIAKGSEMIVYDVAIKMAIKLFREKQERKKVQKILSSAIELMNKPIFISGTNGDIIYANKVFLGMQEPNAGLYGYKSFSDFAKELDIFNMNGDRQPYENWANIKGLRGLKGNNEPYYVHRRLEGKILLGHFTYGPISDENDQIIGSYVVVNSIGPVELGENTKKIMENIDITG